MFNPDVELEDNLAEMNEAIENVKSGEVTYAIKDTTYDGLEIKKMNIWVFLEKIFVYLVQIVWKQQKNCWIKC